MTSAQKTIHGKAFTATAQLSLVNDLDKEYIELSKVRFDELPIPCYFSAALKKNVLSPDYLPIFLKVSKRDALLIYPNSANIMVQSLISIRETFKKSEPVIVFSYDTELTPAAIANPFPSSEVLAKMKEKKEVKVKVAKVKGAKVPKVPKVKAKIAKKAAKKLKVKTIKVKPGHEDMPTIQKTESLPLQTTGAGTAAPQP